MSLLPKTPKKILEAMKAISRSKEKIVNMEVIGENGLKVGEYVENGKEIKRPYHILRESYQNVTATRSKNS